MMLRRYHDRLKQDEQPAAPAPAVAPAPEAEKKPTKKKGE